MMEQRNQMLRELRLNKKESMGVVSVNNSRQILVFYVDYSERNAKKKQINEFPFLSQRKLSSYCSRSEALSQLKINGESN
jgi:hypothetical protein